MVAAVTAIVRMTKEKSLAFKSVFMICGLTRDPALYAGQKAADLGKIEAARDSGNSVLHGLRGGPPSAQNHTRRRRGGSE